MASPSSLHHYSCEVPFALLAALLQRCSSPNALRKARQLHALIVTTTPSTSSPFTYNNLLSLYSKCRSIGDARRVFDRMPTRNLVSYNTMIAAHSRAPLNAHFALQLFHQLVHLGLRPNASTLSSLVHASSSLQDQRVGATIHSMVVSSGFSSNVCVQTALLGMYSDLGSLQAANFVFDEMSDRDSIAWNSILFSNVSNGDAKQGLQLFCIMMREGSAPTNCTFSIALNACGRTGNWNGGRIIHGQIIKSEFPPDLPLQNSLLDMYSSCRDLTATVSVFEGIEEPDLVSWNSLIAGYSDNGDEEKAMDVFVRLRATSHFGGPDPDEYTFSAVISATAALPSICYGEPLHAHVNKTGFEQSIYVGNTLINMYFINGEPDSARKFFICLPKKDAIIWTEMIVGHVRLGEGELAIKYFCHMQEEGHRLDSFSLSSALNSSADLVALKQGEMTHSLAVKTGYEQNMIVGASLVDMYGKNGNLEGARSVFYRIANPCLKCWNSLIGAYGNHGDADQAFKLFNEMIGRGLQPDRVTYVSLLSACSHCGLVERGRFYWFCMTSDGIKPGLKHYTCMASLLGRAGQLQEAEELIERSPFVDNSIELWRILLSSCIGFKNFAMGVHAAERVLSIEPNDSATHVSLSNLYASVGRWDDVAEMRKRIRGLNLEKDPGLSWIEMKRSIHAFSADDESHVQVVDCREELERLKGNLNKHVASELPLSL